MSEEWQIISMYSWQQGVEDGLLVPVFENRWPQLSSGIPILATSHLFEEVSLAALREVWNDFIVWQRDVMPKLKEADRMFVTMINGNDVWLIADGSTYTMLYPEDY